MLSPDEKLGGAGHFSVCIPRSALPTSSNAIAARRLSYGFAPQDSVHRAQRRRAESVGAQYSGVEIRALVHAGACVAAGGRLDPHAFLNGR